MTRPALGFIVAIVLLPLCLPATTSAATNRLYIPNRQLANISGLTSMDAGGLTPLTGSPFPSGAPYPDAMSITPEGRRAFTANGFPPAKVVGFSIDSAGTLAAQTPLAPLSLNPYGVATSPDGRFAFAASDGGVQSFSISPTGTLTQIGSGSFGNTNTIEVRLTPDGKYLFALPGGGNLIQRYAVQADGTLSRLGGTPTLTANPTSFAITPNGQFLYSAASADDTLATFAVGADGSLTPVGSPGPLGAGTNVGDPVVSPNGRFVYIGDFNLNAVRVFAIAANGVPTQLPSGGSLTGVFHVILTPDGRFIYEFDENIPITVKGYAVNSDGTIGGLVASASTPGGDPLQGAAVPAQAPTASFKVTPAAPGAATKFDAGGSTAVGGKIARYDWSFGDGKTLDNGGATPTHTYAKPGAYDAKLTVTDDQNCSTQIVWAGYEAYCNGGPSATKTVKVDTLPVISGLGLTNRAFAVAAATGKRVKRGTQFRYTLSEAANVAFTIERKTSGRKSGKKCKAKTRKNTKKRKCALLKKVGTLRTAAKSGKNKTRFSGKLQGRKLRPGSYRATAVATDSANGKSSPKAVSFKVVRG